MEFPTQFSKASPPRLDTRKGYALVVVLLATILVVGLVIALLQRVTAGRSTASAYAKNIETQVYADTALNLIISQILDATAGNKNTVRKYPNTDSARDALAWASQPGAIRTYDVSGNFYKGYKLYSASSMVETDESTLAEGISGSFDWRSRVGEYVNLNEPVKDADGSEIFPISTPPGLMSVPITGYSVDDATQTNTLEMPVQWLYLLEDGTLAPGRSEEGRVTVAAASKDNPVRARIAFWTDDETSKVNLNTASEGVYWDTPRVWTSQGKPEMDSKYQGTLADDFNPTGTDVAYGYVQPAKNEFNRFPGHPAMTSMSAIFPELNPQQILSLSSSPELSPRIGWGGSKMGTVAAVNKASSPVSLPLQRLYASVGEAVFSPNRSENDGVTSSIIKERQFLLSESSRAPELNLLGRPRVAMWPVRNRKGEKYQTTYDELIAFCATLANPNNTTEKWPFLFLRDNAYSPTEDAEIPSNRKLYEYLQDVTDQTMPGVGGSFVGKYGTNGRDQILTEILDYIRCTNIFDAALEGAEYTGRDDKKTSNENPPREFTLGVRDWGGQGYPGYGQVVPMRIGNTMGLGRTHTISEVSLQFICTADASFADSNQTEGVSKNSTLDAPLVANQRRVQAMLLLELATPMQGYPHISPSIEAEITGADGITANGFALFPFGTGSLKTHDASGDPAAARQTNQQNAEAWKGISACGYAGFFPFVAAGRAPRAGIMPADNATSSFAPNSQVNGFGGSETSHAKTVEYPFISAPFTVDSAKMNINFGALTVNLYYMRSPSQGGGRVLYQTLHIPAVSGEIPTPNLVKTTPDNPVEGPLDLGNNYNYWTFARDGAVRQKSKPWGRMGYFVANSMSYAFIRPEDTLFSIELKDGDFRRTMAMPEVPAGMFHLVKGVGFGAGRVHSLTCPYNSNYPTEYAVEMNRIPGRSVGSLFSAATGSAWIRTLPDVPPKDRFEGDNKPFETGDWDTGTAAMPDGPFANLPDSGTSYKEQGSASAEPPYFYKPNYETGAIANHFSPNRLVPSSGMLGSLPSGVAGSKTGSWQTLLFRPETGEKHPLGKPSDSYFMDLFWMPVVQPYAISEPFSTAGKINLNYEILPFKYIKRQTGLYALLKAERVLNIPVSGQSSYKGKSRAEGTPQIKSSSWRRKINIPETLRQFDEKFEKGEIFRSATQICDLWLVPDNESLSAMRADQFNKYKLTGDNVRERPYANIYPRLTTQSNTYRVHYRVQTLTTRDPGVFSDPEGKAKGMKDSITADRRGSYLIERFLQSDDKRFGNEIDPMKDPLSKAYKIRVLSQTEFNP
jgi:hypothetical protein